MTNTANLAKIYEVAIAQSSVICFPWWTLLHAQSTTKVLGTPGSDSAKMR